MDKKTKVAVLVSGGGTNLQAIIDKVASGELPQVELVKVISSKEGAFALERAAKAGVATAVAKEQADVLKELAKAFKYEIDKSGTYKPGVSPSSTSSAVNKVSALPSLFDT